MALWGLHVAALAGFAVAQPLFDVLGREPTFFVAHHTGPAMLILFALTVAWVPAASLWILSGLLALAGRRVAIWARATIVALLTSIVFLPVCHRAASVGGWTAVFLAAAMGSLFAAAYTRSTSIRAFVSILTPVTVLFPGLLLLASPSSDLLRSVAGQDAPKVDATVPVVLLAFDELPLSSLLDANEEIDAIRYPNFAELSRRATWYRRATTAATGTTYAIPAIVTGRYPEPDTHPSVQDHAQNLFTWLADTYEMHVVETATALCPDEFLSDSQWRASPWKRWRALATDAFYVYLRVVLPPGLNAGVPDVTSNWKDFSTGMAEPSGRDSRRRGVPIRTSNNQSLVSRFVKSFGSESDPGLHFLHLVLPHFPWRYLPSGQEYGGWTIMPRDPKRADYWNDDEHALLQAYQRHLLQVGYTDRLLGQVLKALREKALYDRALVIVTADHGISFRPGARMRSVAPDLVQNVLSVPLFIKLPGQELGETSDHPVEGTDLLPTIAKVLGVTPPWPMDGLPVDDPALAERRETRFFQNGQDVAHKPRTMAVEALHGRHLLDYKLKHFGSGSGGDLYALGPHSDLLGRKATAALSSSAGSSSRFKVELGEAWTYGNVDPEDFFVPVHIHGQFLSGDTEERHPFDLAIAVNGMIRVTTRTYIDAVGDLRFSGLVPTTAFVPGANGIDIFVIEQDGTEKRLVIAPDILPRRTPLDLRLIDGAHGESEIRTADGTALQLAPERFASHSVVGGWGFIGWAKDLRSTEEPVDVVAFFEGRLVSQTRADKRPDQRMLQSSDLDLARSGFALRVIFGRLPEGTEAADLRIFAVHDGAAAEIRFDHANPGANRHAARPPG